MNRMLAFIRSNRRAVAAGVLAAPLLANAQATGVDFSSLTTGIAFTGVVTGILAVAAVKVLPLVAAWGAKKILAMVGR